MYTLRVIVNYSLSQNDFIESQRAYRLRIASKRRWFRNLSGLALLAAILGTYLRLSGNPWLGIAFYLTAVYLVLESFLLWRLRAASVYRDTTYIREPVALTIDESNLIRKTNSGEEEIRWANIIACHETRNLFLLQSDNQELLTIPKRSFSPGDMARFKELRERELLVKTTRDNPDSGLFKFIVAWGLVALAVMTLGIGFVHTFLRSVPRAPRTRRRIEDVTADKPETKPPLAMAEELLGQGRVYLVPIGEIKSVALPAVMDALRRRYGTPLQLLPPVSPSSWARDPVRKQFVAEDLMVAIKLAYPKLAADPEAVLIGLTDEDMFISGIDWQYAYSFRQEERFAIVSSARLSQGEEDEKAVSQKVLQERIQKMLLRDIGVLYYRLQPSQSYNSLLYDDLEDASDIDGVGEGYLRNDVAARADQHIKNGEPCFILRHYAAPERAFLDQPAIDNCSGYYKDANLETVQIDLRYGLLLTQRTDFLVPDQLPLHLTRVLRTQDSMQRSFGSGGNHNLNVFLVGDKWPFTWIDLVLEHGGRSHFKRSNWGFGYWDARYANRDARRSMFAGSTIQWAWSGWKLNRYGTVYEFPDGDRAERPEQAALVGITGYTGWRLSLDRDAAGNLLRAHSSAGPELSFKYDSGNRIVEATQKRGGTFHYSYDGSGHLAQVTDANRRVTTYGYDNFGRLSRVEQDGATICTFRFGTKDRVTSETLADGRTYHFKYSLVNDDVTGVDITDSAGPTRRVWISGPDYTVDTLKQGEY